jgi:hypothetical protein
MKVAEYRLVPIADLEKYKTANTQQRAFDAAFELNVEGEKYKVVKVLTNKKKGEVVNVA